MNWCTQTSNSFAVVYVVNGSNVKLILYVTVGDVLITWCEVTENKISGQYLQSHINRVNVTGRTVTVSARLST